MGMDIQTRPPDFVDDPAGDLALSIEHLDA